MSDRAVSQAEFARIIGCAKSYITALKQAGRLVLDDSGKVLVDASQRRIAETADPVRDDVRARHARQRDENGAHSTVDRENDPKPTGEDPDDEAGNHDFQAARAKKAYFDAEMARIEYEKRLGKLVEKQDVESAVADLVTAFRQAVENMPHRVSAELVAKDIDAIRAILKQEIHGALSDLEREITKAIAHLGDGDE